MPTRTGGGGPPAPSPRTLPGWLTCSPGGRPRLPRERRSLHPWGSRDPKSRPHNRRCRRYRPALTKTSAVPNKRAGPLPRSCRRVTMPPKAPRDTPCRALSCLAASGGRLHCPDDAQAERREVAALLLSYDIGLLVRHALSCLAVRAAEVCIARMMRNANGARSPRCCFRLASDCWFATNGLSI